MEEYNLSDVKLGGSVVALGKFQGLHKGHMLLIDKVIEISNKEQLTSVVLTIDVNVEKLINLPPERYAILDKANVDVNIIAKFTKEFAALSPEEFVKEILVEKLGAKYVVVGVDFRFGYKRIGDVEYLKKMGKKYNFSVISFDKLCYDSTIISTTYIRKLIVDGMIDRVYDFLGRFYSIEGEVTSGKKLGREIGFPTANIHVDEHKILPPNGAYETRVNIDGRIYKSITNIGYNPTIGGNESIIIETHIIDYCGDLYGRRLKVEFLKFLRPERKFESIDELKKQLKRDKMLVMHQ